jgi:hypothetical protein
LLGLRSDFAKSYAGQVGGQVAKGYGSNGSGLPNNFFCSEISRLSILLTSTKWSYISLQCDIVDFALGDGTKRNHFPDIKKMVGWLTF